MDHPMNEEQRNYFNLGRDAALKFQADPYTDLYQDVFRAETSEYKLWIGYSDPDGCAFLNVRFKSSFKEREVSIEYGSSQEAFNRAIKFVTEHPAPTPVCMVDY